MGASFDTPQENKLFKDSQDFAYPLLSDTAKTAGTAYEVCRPDDHQYAHFPMRISYLIDPEGTIRKAYEVSDVAGHAAQVLGDLVALEQL